MPAVVSSLIAFLFIALPWLNPFSYGPSPAVMPLLFSWTCSLAMYGSYRFGKDPATLQIDQESIIRIAGAAWLAAALLSSILGLFQYFGATAAFEPWVNATQIGVAFGNLRQRNQFATLINIGLCALIWWVMQPVFKKINTENTKLFELILSRKYLALAAAIILGIGNAASSSRTGLLQLLLLIFVNLLWGFWRSSPVRQVLFTATFAYGVSAVALPILIGWDLQKNGILARIHGGDSICGSRLTMWGNVLDLISQKPWFGWGWGELAFAHFTTLYSGPRFCDLLGNAHNLPLQLAVELGIPVSLAFCVAFALSLWYAKPWRENNATRQLAWAVIAVILLHSMLEYPLWYGPFQMAFALCIWMLLRTPETQGEIKTSGLLSHYWRAWTAIVLIAFLSYVAWDYQRINQIYLPPAEREAAYRENTLAKISSTWLFKHQVNFAGLTTAELNIGNAAQIHDLALDLLHFSPEPTVVKSVIESAELLGLKDEAQYYRERFKAAYPEEYTSWLSKNND